MKKLIILLLATFLVANEGGKDVFLNNCANCHSTTGTDSMGPDLNLISYIKSKQEIKDYIIKPSMIFRRYGYTSNAMPELPLTPEEVDDVVDYIDKLQPFKVWMK